MKMPKAQRELHDLLLDAGWSYQGQRGGHHKYRHPDGRSTILACSPSDYRALANSRARVRRLLRGQRR